MKKQTFLFLFCSMLAVKSVAQSPARNGNDYAYLFFVKNFDAGVWTNLPETKEEINDIADELENNYGFQVKVVPDATKTQIETTLLAAGNRTYGPNDQILIFFSTHGFFIENEDRGYLIPKDGKSEKQDPLRKSWLSYEDLGSYINLIKCEHILVSLDACYSGAFGDRWKSKPRRFEEEGSCERTQKRALFKDSRLYFTSGSKKQKTPAHSKFANAWLSTLRKESDKIITTNDLNYAFGRIDSPKPESGSFTKAHEGGDFVFVHKNACSVAPIIDKTADRKAWRTAKTADNLPAYRKYRSDFPNGEFRPLAEIRINELEAIQQEERDWETAKTANSVTAYNSFIIKYPASDYLDLAEYYRSKLLPVKNPPTDDLPNMVFVQGGTFQMGSKDGEAEEKPIHSVTLSDFYLHKNEVTVKEYLEFANAINSRFPEWMEKGGQFHIKTGSSDHYKGLEGTLSKENHPVVGISWNDAVAYCNWRSEKEGLQKVYKISNSTVTANWNANGYRLPTEAEWEYAARGRDRKDKWGGTSTEGDIGKYANDSGESDGYKYIAPVGSFRPNHLGLYDMSGNVWEWCWDWFADYSSASRNNPRGPDEGTRRAVRGGSYLSSTNHTRCTFRKSGMLGIGYKNFGFRIARAAR
ncbi:MAG: SUMF1/EgtB/PvdO family nonheme iron enzyme [Bacteroidota bacterium]